MDPCSNCKDSLADFVLRVPNKFGSASETTDAHALESTKTNQQLRNLFRLDWNTKIVICALVIFQKNSSIEETLGNDLKKQYTRLTKRRQTL